MFNAKGMLKNSWGRYFISDEKFPIEILDSRSLFTEIKFDERNFERIAQNSSILLVKPSRYGLSIIYKRLAHIEHR